MLRLRKIDLFGFKSFSRRTHIAFGGTGIAAIVGPNGCGKSNIADAILWVLGEQSPRTLRSGRMADCIFNGTATEPPTNLAEVTLWLVDPVHGEPVQGEPVQGEPATVLWRGLPVHGEPVQGEPGRDAQETLAWPYASAFATRC